MNVFDLSPEELRAYRPDRREESDFDEFWKRTLSEAAARSVSPSFKPEAASLATVEVFDAEFSGYGGQRVKAWLLLPRERKGRLPCVVEYIGYGGGRAFPWDWLFWSAAGYAHFVMDSRGQGSSWSPGDTPDEAPAGPSYPGYMTRGIESPDRYYYRRIMTDATWPSRRSRRTRPSIPGGSPPPAEARAAASPSPRRRSRRS